MISRSVGIVVVISALAITLVGIRRHTLHAAVQVESLRREQIALRRQAWALQADIAAFTTPQQIAMRVSTWDLPVLQPPSKSSRPEPTLLADAR